MANVALESEVESSCRSRGRWRWRQLVPLALAAVIGSVSAVEGATPTSKVRFYMNMGTVEIALYGNESPLNVANFLSYVDNGSYDDSFIHRTRSQDLVQPLGYDLFAQGGSFKYPTNNFIDSNPITPGPPVQNEFNAANGLSNTPGTIAAARSSDPNSATSGWFINQTNNAGAFDPGPYTVFGQVTLGMSIINQIPFLPNIQAFQGTAFESTPLYNGDLVTIQRAVRIPLIAGDYNFSGSVTSADYTTWRNNLGSTINAAADGNGNGVVDAADYIIWRKAMTHGSGSGAGDLTAISAPEPSGALLTVISGMLMATRRNGFAARRSPKTRR